MLRLTPTSRRRFLQWSAAAIGSGWFAGRPLHAESTIEASAHPYLLQMIRDDSVHRELRLTPAQITQLDAALELVDPRWWRSRILAPEAQRNEIRELTALLRQELARAIDADQANRLLQLERQAHGTRMVARPDVIEALAITPAQQQTFAEHFAKTDRESATIAQQASDESITAEQAAARLQTLKAAERDSLMSGLTSDQRAGIGGLVGATFNFSGVKRTYPRGPELIAAPESWINGGPTSLAENRGNVVAIHFYAFQCINCQRNFPHYKSWDADLRDRGLRVIGIQSPETSAERNRERVAAAARSDGFAFPVLFDASSQNWNAWANTMWPTVYLLDKKGFVRRWWQGEMNWQGTPGEQQMRQTIEELLSEPS